MKSRTSLLNRGILRNDMKSLGWLGAVYLLGLLLSTPLKILMIFSRSENQVFNTLNNPYVRIFQFNSELQLLLLVTIPVLTGLLLFRYLQSGKTADMIHALPVRRETLFSTHVITGIIFLFIPLIITALVSWALIMGLGITYVSTAAIFTWLGIALLINLLLFMTCVATGILSGMSSVQGVLAYILLFLPVGLSLLLISNMNLYVYGFANDYYSRSLNILSPLNRIVESNVRPLTAAEIVVYLLCSLALYLLGRNLYKRRPLEMAGNAIAFAVLKPIFKYGVTLCSMLVLGSYFHSTQQSLGWTYFGYILGAFLGYFLSEILMQKSIYVFKLKTAKGFLMFTVVMMLLGTVLNYDIMNYEKKMPALAEVESVYLDYSYHNFNRPERADSYREYGGDFKRDRSMIYTGSDTIAQIYDLHQALLDNRAIEKRLMHTRDRNHPRQNICLAYNLKNGDKVYRQYNIALSRYAPQLKPLYEGTEYKNMVYDIFHVSPAAVNLIEINAEDIDRRTKITDPELIEEAVAALQKDKSEQTYEQMTANQPSWASIRIFMDNDQSIYLEWEKSAVNFEKWLQEVGEYENARVMPEDIKYALVEKRPADYSRDMAASRTKEAEQYLAELEQKGGCLKITSPEEIETCLRTCSYHDGQGYDVYFVFENGNIRSCGLKAGSAPDFVEEYFREK